MAKKEDQKTKKERIPSALKRDRQAQERNLRNRVFKSRVKTAIRDYEAVVPKGDKDATLKSLNEIYSLMDKGVKKGVFKPNKASRTKSRLSKRAAA